MPIFPLGDRTGRVLQVGHFIPTKKKTKLKTGVWRKIKTASLFLLLITGTKEIHIFILAMVQ
ncbi:MAG: hypothetical protein COT35_05220 [Nitrospirae bacterium CG08_land_8_20_14_0_20_52_24]|nr:MAG: hypothetical protein COT35_05220 [Nitrospirae bacterium CG08_land_8_20_14_0_20_52_24]